MTWSDRDFELLFRVCYPRVLRSAHLLLGDRASAEDVAQEAFARLLARGALPPEEAERWVFKVGRNLAIDRMRAVKRFRPLSEAEAMEGWDTGDETERRAVQLNLAVRALPPRQQEVVALRIYGELSYEAIAAATGHMSDLIRRRDAADWVRGGKSAVLAVPSAVVESERIFLLNPAHRFFRRVRIGRPHPFAMDERPVKPRSRPTRVP